MGWRDAEVEAARRRVGLVAEEDAGVEAEVEVEVEERPRVPDGGVQ